MSTKLALLNPARGKVWNGHVHFSATYIQQDHFCSEAFSCMLLSHLNIQLTRGSHYIAIYAFWIHRFDFIWPNSRMHTHTHTQNGYDRPIARIGQILAKEILISMQKCSINEQQYLPLSKLPSKFHAIAGAVDFRGLVYGIHQWIHSIRTGKTPFQAFPGI